MPKALGGLILDVNAASLRVGLRAYLTVLFFVITALGDRCCALRARVLLMRKHSVPILQMTGWLDGFPALKIMLSQRRLPAGWLGAIMIIAWVIDFSADLMVSGLVRTRRVVGRCPFTTGVICNPHPNNMTNSPDPYNTAVRWVQQAQNTSRSNGGLVGIFKKVNTDPSFRADPNDMLGNWTCDFTYNDTYPSSADLNQVTSDLQNRGRLYNNTAPSAYWGIQPGAWNSYTVWNPSVSDGTYQIFDVRVTRDVTWQEGPNITERVFSSFQCTMNAPEINWILHQMAPEYTLHSYVPMLHGNLDDAFDHNITELITTTLELITMVGSEGRIPWYRSPPSNSTIDTTQGCLAARAEIPTILCLILLLVTIGTLGIAAHFLSLAQQLKKLMHRDLADRLRLKDLDERVPNGLVGWILYGAREHFSQPQLRAKDLSSFSFIQQAGKDMLVETGGRLRNTSQEELQYIQAPAPVGPDFEEISFWTDNRSSHASELSTTPLTFDSYSSPGSTPLPPLKSETKHPYRKSHVSINRKPVGS